MRRKTFWIAAFLFVLIFVGLDADAGGPKPPSFELFSLDGKTFTEKELIGKTTLVVFWASWCDVCQQELPKVHDLREKLKGKPFQVIAIGFRDTEENIRGYVKSHSTLFNFPVLYDAGDRVATRFGAHVTPTLFLLNKKGELVVPYRGGGLLENPRFNEVLQESLKEA